MMLSIISWSLLLITEFLGFIFLNNYHAIWTFWRIGEHKSWPLQMHYSFEYIVFSILFIITIIAFCYYINKVIVNKDSVIMSGMSGNITKYHFIPLVCASVLFIIGYFKGSVDDSGVKVLNIFGLIFVIIGLITLIFIYIKTSLPCDYLPGSIKKGLYSCLITLEFYYFLYDICNLAINNGRGEKDMDGYSGFFIVFLGLGGLAFAIYYKDIIVDAMLFLIYLGNVIFYYNNSDGYKYNKGFDGVFDIIMLILLIAEMAFIIIKYKKECLQ